MVPSRLALLDALPRTATGKVDRRALVARGLPEAAGAQGVGPRSESEARILEVFAESLGHPVASVHEDFFDLGGSSLSAVHLVRRLEELAGRPLPLGAIFQGITAARAARWVDDPVAVQQRPRLVPLTAGERARWLLVAPPGHRAHAVFPQVVAGLDGGAAALEGPVPRAGQGLDELAEHWLAQVDVAADAVLVGYSNGGLVALELARLLSRQGRPVRRVGLVDTVPPPSLWSQAERAGFLERDLSAARRTAFLDGLARLGSAPLDDDALGAAHAHFVEVARYTAAAVQSHVPAFVQDVELLLVATQRSAPHIDPLWRAFAAGRLRSRVVACTHSELLDRPHVHDWVPWLCASVEPHPFGE